MAKKNKNGDTPFEGKSWREGELIESFKLKRTDAENTPLMQEWLDVQPPVLNAGEQYLFDRTWARSRYKIVGWNEEDLKMKFITYILELGHLNDDDNVTGYFDKTISAIVDEIPLVVKSDFMLARGILDVFKTPYFHFQEYKPHKHPSGDSMAQLLEAFLIAQVKNNTSMPLYGVEISSKHWVFVLMDGRKYCTSKSFDASDKEDLLKIISILRKFRWILENRLLVTSS
jgi:hypothetical protein